jgi:hypothetical protein
MKMSDLDFLHAVRSLNDQGASLAGIEALENQLTYFFLLQGRTERLQLEAVDQSAPSLIQIYGTADPIERFLHRQYGLKFVGNPNLGLGL